MDYLIVSTAVVDQISYPNKKDNILSIGGAGFYAYSGARIWNKSVNLVCGKGNDFEKVIKPYFTKDNISDECMFKLDLPTPTTKVEYDESGERIETPVYGAIHYQKFVADIERIEQHCKNIKGLYIFKEAEDIEFWTKLFELKKKYKFKILWEISSDSTKESNLSLIKTLSKEIDIFSINKTEATSLFNCKEMEVEEKFKQFNFDLVFYRKGAKGATLISREDKVFAPSVDRFTPIDPTGAGNSSSAAVLVGYCENKSLLEIGLMGSISAGFIISQNGAPLTQSNEISEKAIKYLQEELKEENNVR